MGKASSKLSPETVGELARQTHFDKREIQQWHQSFLQECPSGMLGVEQLLRLYQQFFPFGDPARFVKHLLRLYDRDGDGQISFAEYLAALSITIRGRLEEKIQFAFALYDVDGDGLVSGADLMEVVEAVQDMLGPAIDNLAAATATIPAEAAGVSSGPSEPPTATASALLGMQCTSRQRAEQVFRVLGKDASTDRLDVDDFRCAIHTDPTIVQALLLYDGVV